MAESRFRLLFVLGLLINYYNTPVHLLILSEYLVHIYID